MTPKTANNYGSIVVETEDPLVPTLATTVTGSEQHQRRKLWSSVTPVTAGIFALMFLVSTVKHSRFRNLETTTVRSANLEMARGAQLTDSSIAEVEGPTKAYFYDDQLVDHHDTEKHETFTQRYYQKGDYFGGPGSPIFLIFGGEDPLENLLYPFIYDHLAKSFDAYTFALEHRFFGVSLPVQNATNAQLAQLLTPDQALWDAVRFIQHKRRELGCSLNRKSPHYCPVITVGGSYPGFLSALMRFVHSDVVDISYASSAPFDLYSHHVDQGAYYEKVTSTADQMSPGCADSVRQALLAAQEDIVGSDDRLVLEVAAKYGICRESVPKYIQTNVVLSQEIMLIIATHFAEGNMMAYPPGPELDIVKGCHIFQNQELETPEAKVAAYLGLSDEDADCFDLMTELPPGPNATISASDWSGVGSGPEGFYWEFLSCLWIPECGMSAQSMFPERHWSLEWMTQHCMSRFDLHPDIHSLNSEFDFDDRTTVQRLLLTNGIVDGWSIASVLQEREDTPGVRVVNMVNGAHHSDLSHTGPSEHDTPDVKAAYIEITGIIDDWLKDVRAETKQS